MNITEIAFEVSKAFFGIDDLLLMGAAAFVTTVVGSTISGVASSKTNEANKQINADNLEFAREQFEWQSKFSQQEFDYQKALHQQIFAREDTKAQREVADLQRAGLSPLLYSGASGSSPSATVSMPNSQSPSAVPMQTPALPSMPDMADIALRYYQTETEKQENASDRAHEWDMQQNRQYWQSRENSLARTHETDLQSARLDQMAQIAFQESLDRRYASDTAAAASAYAADAASASAKYCSDNQRYTALQSVAELNRHNTAEELIKKQELLINEQALGFDASNTYHDFASYNDAVRNWYNRFNDFLAVNNLDNGAWEYGRSEGQSSGVSGGINVGDWSSARSGRGRGHGETTGVRNGRTQGKNSARFYTWDTENSSSGAGSGSSNGAHASANMSEMSSMDRSYVQQNMMLVNNWIKAHPFPLYMPKD